MRAEGARLFGVRGGTVRDSLTFEVERFEMERFEVIGRSRRSGRRSSADSLRAETLVSILGRRKGVGSSCFRISSALRSLSDDRRPLPGMRRRSSRRSGSRLFGVRGGTFEAGGFETVECSRRSGRRSSADSLRAETLVSTLGRGRE